MPLRDGREVAPCPPLVVLAPGPLLTLLLHVEVARPRPVDPGWVLDPLVALVAALLRLL